MDNQNNFPLMTAKLILFFVIRTKGHITKTQLVKFLYLADLYSMKWLGKQITDLNWYFYNHGPWEKDIQTILNKMNGKQIKLIQGFGGAVLVKPGTQIPNESDLCLPESMALMLENIRKEWAGSGSDNFKKLMDYVYETAPMKDLLERGFTNQDKEPLNLKLAYEHMLDELKV